MENVYAPPKSDIEGTGDATGEDAFYVVSVRKFTVLYLATLGVYAMYWVFRNWSRYKKTSGENVWPVPRAFFSVFFMHGLFRRIHERLAMATKEIRWNYRSHATGLVIMLIISHALSRASAKSFGSPFVDVVSIAILVPLTLSYRKAQRHINAACGDPDGVSNNELTLANYLWIALGFGLWVFTFIGIVFT